MTWHVEPTVIDEIVPAPRDAYHVVNERGEVADDSVSEIEDVARDLADELNRAEA
jgi:hypothetical protein